MTTKIVLNLKIFKLLVLCLKTLHTYTDCYDKLYLTPPFCFTKRLHQLIKSINVDHSLKYSKNIKMCKGIYFGRLFNMISIYM